MKKTILEDRQNIEELLYEASKPAFLKRKPKKPILWQPQRKKKQ